MFAHTPDVLPRKAESAFVAQTDAGRFTRSYSLHVTPVRRKIPGTGLPLWLQGPWPVAFVALVGFAGLEVHHFGVHYRFVTAIAVAGAGVILLLRGRSPIVALAAVLALAAATDYGPIASLATLLALVNVVMRKDRTIAALAAVATAVVLIVTPAIHGTALDQIPPILSRMVAVGLAVAVGLYLRARVDYLFGLRDRAERLERERELLSQQAVADERVRIARELHDVVAHNISLMVVQAQALAATDPGGERCDSLNSIAATGREALSEMHRMLGVLRIEDVQSAERAPQPGIRDLDALIARTRDAGLQTSLNVDGTTRELPSAVELSAYRIVQEALTNVIRHAGAKHAEVNLHYGARTLELTVLDDGAGVASSNGHGEQGGGHGLVGMRERVALFGGELDAGPRDGGHGYRVHASLPLS
jgi:signal transduction histidine kinase